MEALQELFHREEKGRYCLHGPLNDRIMVSIFSTLIGFRSIWVRLYDH